MDMGIGPVTFPASPHLTCVGQKRCGPGDSP